MLRRTFLLSSAAGLALSTAGSSTSTTVDLGPAAQACTSLTGGFVGDRPYIVSHLLLPARLGIFDTAAGSLVKLAELPTGGGAWTSLVVDDQIFIGTHTVADLYRFDTATMTLHSLGRLPGATYVWDMSRTSDGKIFMGTYPDGKVWELDPASGAVRDVGVALAGQTYVRSITADATTVYAGLGAQARLIAIDRASGERRDITQPELTGESFVYQLTQTATHVVAGTHGTGLIAIIDKADPSKYRVVHPEGVITIGKMAASGDDVYFGAGDALWHLSLSTGTTTKVATTAGGDFITAVHIRGGTVAAFTNSATMSSYDVASASMSMVDFQALGMPKAPELPMSVQAHGGTHVYVGGHGGVEVHTPGRPGAASRFRVSGEVKAMTTAGRYLYLAMYPSGSIIAYDTVTRRMRTLGVIGHEQNRPGDIAYHPRRRQLLVASSPDYGKGGGALSVHDLDSGRLDVHRNIVTGHAILSVAVHPGRDLAYAGSDRAAVPTGSAAVAVFDLRTRTKTGEIVPVPGAPAIPCLAVFEDVLYGTTSKGVLFAVDTRTGAVLATATVAGGRVDLVAAGERLYAVSHQQVLRITPRTLAVEVVADGLAADPTSFPMITFDEESGALYVIGRRNLIQVRPSGG